MKSNNSWSGLCAGLREGDGLDAFRKDSSSPSSNQKSVDRHLQRFAGQARRALSLSLADCADPRLHHFHIHEVALEPGGALLVSVRGPAEEWPEAMLAFEACTGRLRADLARLVPSKQVPRLQFQFHPEEEGACDDA